MGKLAKLVGAVAVTAAMVLGASAAFAGPSRQPTLTCAAGTYGSPVSCEVTDGAGLEVLWPDGSRSTVHVDGPITASVDAVGVVAAMVVDGDDVLVTAPLEIAPDLAVVCADGAVDTVYEIVPWADGEHGWGYAYVDPSDGREVRPGEPDYPADPGLTSLHLVEVERVTTTGRCEAVSAALDRFDGSVWFEFDAPFEEPLRLPLRTPVPFSRSHWVGTQPAEMTVTISVGRIDASERRGVYVSGCT